MSRNNLTWDEARERAELISDVRYRVGLDLTEDDGFRSEAVVTFRSANDDAETFIDLTAPELLELTVNGERRNPADAFDGNRVRLDGLKQENEVRVVARCAYNRTEVGMHHFVDPVDGNVYVHTHLEPFGCHRVLACFDQPDIKGTFDFTVRARHGWEVISNGPVASRDGEPAPDGVGAWPGQYKVIVHYYRANPNLLGGETHVNVSVTRFAGTAQEVTERHTVILKKAGEEVEVCKVRY